MQYYISEEEAQYMDAHHGQFSRKLATWAIGNMKYKDETTDTLKPIVIHQLDEVEETMQKHGVKVDDAMIYTAWYLYNMACADYRKALPSKEVICYFIDETLNDPDCDPSAVLACFRAKMDVKGVPIHWERYI